MVTLWQSESRAREENEGPDAALNEVPIRFTVSELRAKGTAQTSVDSARWVGGRPVSGPLARACLEEGRNA